MLYDCETVCWHFPADTVRYHFRLQELWSHSVLRFAGNRLQIAAVRLQWFFGMLGLAADVGWVFCKSWCSCL